MKIRQLAFPVGITMIILVTTVLWVTDLIGSMDAELKNLRKEYNRTLSEIAELKVILRELINRTAQSSNPVLVEISELVNNPTACKGKLVAVIGQFHSVVTIPEIKLPYNAVLTSENLQIGVNVDPSKTIGLEGSKVLVVGFLMQGVKRVLSLGGWVDAGNVWYLKAVEVKRI